MSKCCSLSWLSDTPSPGHTVSRPHHGLCWWCCVHPVGHHLCGPCLQPLDLHPGVRFPGHMPTLGLTFCSFCSTFVPLCPTAGPANPLTSLSGTEQSLDAGQRKNSLSYSTSQCQGRGQGSNSVQWEQWESPRVVTPGKPWGVVTEQS